MYYDYKYMNYCIIMDYDYYYLKLGTNIAPKSR